MMKMGKTRYKTRFGNLNASGIIERLKKRGQSSTYRPSDGGMQVYAKNKL